MNFFIRTFYFVLWFWSEVLKLIIQILSLNFQLQHQTLSLLYIFYTNFLLTLKFYFSFHFDLKLPSIVQLLYFNVQFLYKLIFNFKLSKSVWFKILSLTFIFKKIKLQPSKFEFRFQHDTYNFNFDHWIWSILPIILFCRYYLRDFNFSFKIQILILNFIEF